MLLVAVGFNRRYLDKFYANGYDDIRMMEFLTQEVLTEEIGFRNKLSMNLVLHRVQWLRESQREFKETLCDKLKLPKRYLLLFNERGIVNMEYLVRFICDRQGLALHIGITIAPHLDALWLEMKRYRNGTDTEYDVDEDVDVDDIQSLQAEGRGQTQTGAEGDQLYPTTAMMAVESV